MVDILKFVTQLQEFLRKNFGLKIGVMGCVLIVIAILVGGTVGFGYLYNLGVRLSTKDAEPLKPNKVSYQSAYGNNISQFATMGDNSPITYEIKE